MTSPSDSALTIYRPLVTQVVAALGALITHQLAYLLATLAVGSDSPAGPDHRHLSVPWAVVAPLAVGAVGGFIVWQLRRLGFRSPISARRLGVLIVVFFAAQESMEALLAGHGIPQLATNPAVVAGLLVAPLVAWALARILSGVTELVAALLAADSIGPPLPTRLAPLPVRWTSATPRSSSRPRAPPRSPRR